MAYSTERRAAVLKKLEPANAVPLRQLAKEEGISEATLHAWRRDARSKGQLLPDVAAGPEGWTSRDKFAAVLETAALNEADLAAYCRQRGLYTEQVQGWRTACEQANDWERSSSQRLGQATREEKKRIKALEWDLARKEKALAETAALLVLRKTPRRSGGQRGRMISTPNRQNAIALINQAKAAGARRAQACAELGIDERTCRRWRARDGYRRIAARRRLDRHRATSCWWRNARPCWTSVTAGSSRAYRPVRSCPVADLACKGKIGLRNLPSTLRRLNNLA